MSTTTQTSPSSGFGPRITQLTVRDSAVSVCIEDGRSDAVALFTDLSATQQEALAADIWTIGARALGSAYRQAREAKLEDIGNRLFHDVERHVRAQFEMHQQALQRALATYFDPSDGEVTRRLADFVADEGVLSRFLRAHMGREQIALATTLAGSVGRDSELFKRLDPDAREGVVCTLEERLSAVMQSSQQQIVHALDPQSEHGPVARLLRALHTELQETDQERTAQLSRAVAALDANDESSALSRLMHETRDAKTVLLESLNPQDPRSPLAAIRRTVEEMLDKHGQLQRAFFDDHQQRYRELATLVQESVVRKATEAKGPRGGATFEAAVIEFAEHVTRGGQYIVEATGNSTGRRSRSKVGDAVISFGEESAFAGCRVVLEAKRDSSYTLPRALQESRDARDNRGADVAVFVFAASHAPAGLEDFSRHGNTIVVAWDPEDPSTDPVLRGAIVAALAMARRKQMGDKGDLEALADVDKRIHIELSRLGRMRSATDRIVKASDELRSELRKAETQFETLLEKAKSTLRGLNVELVDEESEAASPITLPRMGGPTASSVGDAPRA